MIVLSDEAECDLSNIVTWTAENFGPRQAERYADLLLSTIDLIADDLHAPRSKQRDEIGSGLRTLHLKKPGRHFILYREGDPGSVQIVRILHDSMEISRHLPDEPS